MTSGKRVHRITRSWCGRATRVAPYLPPVPARRTARRWAVRMRSTNHHVSTARTPFRHLTAYGEAI